jgi:hypothetical protein
LVHGIGGNTIIPDEVERDGNGRVGKMTFTAGVAEGSNGEVFISPENLGHLHIPSGGKIVLQYITRAE